MVAGSDTKFRMLARATFSHIGRGQYMGSQVDATKSTLADASSLLALAATTPAVAQNSNLDIERDSAGVVDVISSKDIGKFPDSNVAASLQLVPGVSIQRSGTRGRAHGNHARLRRRSNETSYDGRRISTATGGHSIDFSTVVPMSWAAFDL